MCNARRGERTPTRVAGTDGMGASPVPVQMWAGRAQSRCRCGRGEPGPGADVAGASPVLVQMWQGVPAGLCLHDQILISLALSTEYRHSLMSTLEHYLS